MDWIVGLKPLSIWQSFIVRWCAFTSVKFYLGLIFCIMCKKKLNSYDHVLSLVTGFMTEISFSSTLMSSSTLFPFSVCSATRVSFLLSPQHTVKAHNNEKRSDQAAKVKSFCERNCREQCHYNDLKWNKHSCKDWSLVTDAPCLQVAG